MLPPMTHVLFLLVLHEERDLLENWKYLAKGCFTQHEPHGVTVSMETPRRCRIQKLLLRQHQEKDHVRTQKGCTVEDKERSVGLLASRTVPAVKKC
ncbi:hypothetical protein CapIbe_018116 [Capra ibex]